MQVQPLLPLRNVVIAPPAPAVTIEALRAIDAGAADSALEIGSPPLAAASLVLVSAAAELAPLAPSPSFVHPVVSKMPVSSSVPARIDIMSPSIILRKDGRCSTLPIRNHPAT